MGEINNPDMKNINVTWGEIIVTVMAFCLFGIWLFHEWNVVNHSKRVDFDNKFMLEIIEDSTYLDNIHFHEDNNCWYNKGEWITSCDTVWIKID